jgi:hypothetical protein
MEPDGTLWALVVNGYFTTGGLWLMRSTDRGFSWEIVANNFTDEYDLRDVEDTTFDGPAVALLIDSQWNNLDCYYAYYVSLGDSWGVFRHRFLLNDVDTTSVAADRDIVNSGDDELNEGSFQIDHNTNQAFCVYSSGTALRTRRVSPRSDQFSAAAEFTDTSISNLFGIRTNGAGETHILYSPVIGSKNRVRYTRYTEKTVDYATAVEIKDLGNTTTTMTNPAIAYDGYGTLMAMWDESTTTGSQQFYSISTDNGANWSTAEEVPMTDGQTDYEDPNHAGVFVSMLDIIGGQLNGFLMSYTRMKGGYSRCFVRQLSTDDGSTYTLGEEKEIATTSYPNRHITGGKFFKPSGSILMDLREPGIARIAFTVDQGDGETGLFSTTPVVFAQELLSECAYATEPYETEGATYTIETASPGNIVVSFNNVGGPNQNIDFYGAGLTGTFTTRYQRAFLRLGTSHRLLRYEPDVENEMNDRSAYGAPTETTVQLMFDPQSYAFPTPSISSAEYTTWVEQDIRRVLLPPQIHLARTFLVNDGGYLKRTVWVLEHDGNQYELSQVVPRFMNNEICFYECNAYVIGPSRDPFSRTILPSET